MKYVTLNVLMLHTLGQLNQNLRDETQTLVF